MYRIAVVLFAVACATAPTLVESDPDALAMGSGDYSLAEHQIDTIWLWRTNGECGTSSGGWQRARMFPGAPGLLSKYCKAEFSGSNPNPDPPGGLPANARRDRIALAPMSTPSDSDYALNTRSRTLPLDDLPALAGSPTRIALLDSIPDGTLDQTYFSSSTDFYDHGFRLAVLNRRLSCDSDGIGDCAATQEAYLTLGWQIGPNGEKVRDPNQGGVVGSQGDLAQRIFDAVDDWEQDRANSEDVGRLVINLSLGWHPDAGGAGSPNLFDTPVRAIYNATQYASCKGALVLAASGNLGGQVGDVALPLYPAAWESLPAPSHTTCDNAFGLNVHPIGTASYARLVYGVGAVNENHEPLGMSRPGSVPTHVAAGSHLAFDNAAAGGLMDSITGTSAATAVVSASAAVVRAYSPTLTAHETMETLRTGALNNSGWTTGDDPEYCAGTDAACDEVHVISVCHALEAAGVPLNSTHCNPNEALHTYDSSPDSPTHIGFDPDSQVATCDNGFVSTTTTPSLPDNVDSVCPIEELEGAAARPMTLPMPPSNPCIPDCTFFLDANGTDHTIEIPLGTSLSSATVMIKTTTGVLRSAAIGEIVEGTTYSIKGTGLVKVNETLSYANLSYVPSGMSKSYTTDMIVK